MPELPEVEVVTSQLKNTIINKTIINLTLSGLPMRFPVNLLPEDLINNVIFKISRRGKNILIYLNKINILINLGLTGTLQIKQNHIPQKHDHVILTFHDQTSLVFNDPRRYGFCLSYQDDPLEHLTHLGVEPLQAEFHEAYLLTKCCKSKSCIKKILMNNAIVVGIGNIYACEILYATSVSPYTLGKDLTMNEILLIVSATKRILRSSIENGGATFRNYKDVLGNPGYNRLSVYQKTSCTTCHGCISRTMISNRVTYFCSKCQQ